MIARRSCKNPVTILFLFLLFQLSGCGGGSGEGSVSQAVEGSSVSQAVEGSVVDGPVVNAIVEIYANDGSLLHTTSSDSSAHYQAAFQADRDQYPLTVEVSGGTNLVTGREPDFDLVSVVSSPDVGSVVNVNSFTTVATEMARRMPGGLSQENVDAANSVVLEQLNFGLDRQQVSNVYHANVTENISANFIRANEALAEMLRRSHETLSGNALSADMATTVQLLAEDLVDGALDGSAATDARVAQAFLQGSLEVLDEAMRNELQVDGVRVASALDDAILVLQPDTSAAQLTDSIPVNMGILLQAESVEAQLAQRTAQSPDPVPSLQLPETVAEPVAKSDGSVVVSSEPVIDPVTVVTIDPLPTNNAPVLSGSPRRNLTVGDAYIFRPVASDINGDTLAFTIINQPAWATFNRSTGRLYGTPEANDVGVKGGIIIEVSDGELTSSIGPFSIRVNAPVVTTESVVQPVKKHNPGHYLALYGYEKQSAMYDAAWPGVRGINKRYTWHSLEPALGVYDFSQIESDLAVAASQGLQLVVMVEDKSFRNDPPPTPEYLWGEQYTRLTRNNGYTAVRYEPYVIERFTALLSALGERFDSHPNLEGVALQESAIGFVQSILDETGYTPEKYRDALIEVVLSAADSFPTSQVFWYMNRTFCRMTIPCRSMCTRCTTSSRARSRCSARHSTIPTTTSIRTPATRRRTGRRRSSSSLPAIDWVPSMSSGTIKRERTRQAPTAGTMPCR